MVFWLVVHGLWKSEGEYSGKARAKCTKLTKAHVSSTWGMLRFLCNSHVNIPNISVKSRKGLTGLVLSPVRSTWGVAVHPIADRGKELVYYSGRLKDCVIRASARSRQEDQHPPKRIQIRLPTPLAPIPPPPTLALALAPTPYAPSLAVHVPVAPSSAPVAATLILRLASLMSDPATTGSPILNHLINEVELASYTDVLAMGDGVDVEIEMDYPATVEGATNDDARGVTSSFYSSWRRKRVFDPNLKTPVLDGLEIPKLMIDFWAI
ncbi:hypothetical protein Ancab_010922 [Ancistrocladus abbreviatus]